MAGELPAEVVAAARAAYLEVHGTYSPANLSDALAMLETLLHERCDHWTIECWKPGDVFEDRGWQPMNELFRTREEAEREAGIRNRFQLRIKNELARDEYEADLRNYRIRKNLVKNRSFPERGLLVRPDELVTYTELADGDIRYRAVRFEFESKETLSRAVLAH